MGDIQILLLVAALVALVVVVSVALPFLKRRGVDVGACLGQVKDALDTVDKAFDAVRPFLQEDAGAGTFGQVLAAAHVGVQNAEQLCAIGELGPGQRKEAAREYVAGALSMMGVDCTPEVGALIDGAIESEVLGLKNNALKGKEG